MKHILFLIFFTCAVNVHAKQVILDIPDNDIKIVENDVLDAEQWIKDAWTGKVNKCKERILKQEIDRSVQGGEALPAGENAVVQKAFKRANYKNRKQRDLEIQRVR